MNWTQINEICNVVAMLTTLFPIYYGIKSYKKSISHKILLFYLALGFILDCITFYIYKFLDQNSYWLTPFYYFNFFGILSFFYYKALDYKLIKSFLPFITIIGLVTLFSRAFWFFGIDSYDEKTWFCLQSYYIILCLYIFRSELVKAKTIPSKNPIFLISLGVFISCLLPLLSGLLQRNLYETSPDYFQISLIILNISTIFSYLLIGRGIQFLTPTATPKPSQQPREPN